MLTILAVILAAGQGKRMESDLPKVLHKVNGRPMIDYSLDLAQAVTGEKPVIVVGHKANLVVEHIGNKAHFVLQEKQLGTGHAVQQTEELLRNTCQHVLVISADMPLLSYQTLCHVVEAQKVHAGPMTMLTLIADNPRGFGRVIRNNKGKVQAIVEEAVATPEELNVKELNAGVYCFTAGWLWESLKKIRLSPKGEYYLTDLVEIAVANDEAVQAIILSDPTEALGVNTREHLIEAEVQMRKNMAQ